MVFCWISGCHVPLELLSTGCITPGESVPSTFSIGAGLFELQAVKIAILTGSNKNDFFIYSSFKIKFISFDLALNSFQFPA